MSCLFILSSQDCMFQGRVCVLVEFLAIGAHCQQGEVMSCGFSSNVWETFKKNLGLPPLHPWAPGWSSFPSAHLGTLKQF